jgi:hypothetical protein
MSRSPRPCPSTRTGTEFQSRKAAPAGLGRKNGAKHGARVSDTRNLAVGDVTSAEAYCVATTLNISRGSVFGVAGGEADLAIMLSLISERAGGCLCHTYASGLQIPRFQKSK